MLPTIPAKRYFTIGEVAELCEVKPHVLRYWEQEFTQLRPIKRRGNRRYYQHHEVLMIRRIRDLLYGQGFTINGARNRLQEAADEQRGRPSRSLADMETGPPEPMIDLPTNPASSPPPMASAEPIHQAASATVAHAASSATPTLGDRTVDYVALRNELLQLRALLCEAPAEDTQLDRV